MHGEYTVTTFITLYHKCVGSHEHINNVLLFVLSDMHICATDKANSSKQANESWLTVPFIQM